jgi:secondary thiamine-phosphate synthase enzyme
LRISCFLFATRSIKPWDDSYRKPWSAVNTFRLRSDLRRALDRIASAGESYEHNARWGDGNGFSHVRSALLKTSISIPIIDGQLTLGTWQQIVVINLDNRAREREIVAVICETE